MKYLVCSLQGASSSVRKSKPLRNHASLEHYRTEGTRVARKKGDSRKAFAMRSAVRELRIRKRVQILPSPRPSSKGSPFAEGVAYLAERLKSETARAREAADSRSCARMHNLPPSCARSPNLLRESEIGDRTRRRRARCTCALINIGTLAPSTANKEFLDSTARGASASVAPLRVNAISESRGNRRHSSHSVLEFRTLRARYII